MKKTKLFALLGIVACMHSCQKFNDEENMSDGRCGTLDLTVECAGDNLTKAVSLDSKAYEKQINSVRILVFNSSGDLSSYTENGTNLTASMNIMAGDYTVWAVVNGPDLSAVAKLSDLEKTAFLLSANSTDASKGFIMGGGSSVHVAAGETSSITLAVSRYTSRIQLASVKNELPAALGNISISRAFLCNVAGNQNIKGNAAVETWYNKDGRKDEATRNSGHVIDGSKYTASCPSLTYKAFSGVSVSSGVTSAIENAYFYSYPNSSTDSPAGFNNPFKPCRTMLCIEAVISGKKQYYPVVLTEAPKRNKCYSINLTIAGLGSDDPSKPVEKGTLKSTIVVSDWSAGKEYNEKI